jgi:hypothetical protein
MAGKPSKQRYTPVEKRLVSEFIHAQYPGALMWERPRLGAYRPPKHGTEPKKMDIVWSKVTSHYADAIVYPGDRLIIVEGKIKGDVKAVGQLELYAELVPKTPEFEVLGELDIEKVLVCAHITADDRLWIQKRGVDVHIYAPQWAILYLEQRSMR